MDFHKELIAEFDREAALTRKIFEAIPDNADFAFKPHEKSMPLGRLAGHIAETTGEWASGTLNLDKLEFAADHKFEPLVAKSKADLLVQFDKGAAKAKTDLAAFDPKKWEDHWKFVMGGQAWIDDTKYKVWRTWVVNHIIHHRAQLGAYIRALGGKLPGTYGPSADEM